jgi:pilus assembly protein CpaE
MTILDLPRNMLINFPQLLNDVNVLMLVTELTLASARDTIRLMSWLKTNAPHAHVVIVANKVHAGVGEISKADFESSIERKIAYSIPYDVKAAANAAKLGQTFCEANRTSKASAAIREVAKMVMGAGDVALEDGAAPTKKSLLGKIDLKSMLPNKKKPVTTSSPA